MQDHDPAKRIPKSIGTDAKLLGSYTLTDAAVALLPGVLVVLLTQAILPASLSLAGYRIQTLTIPLAGVAIAIGALFVSVTPAYLTSLDWLAAIVGYQRSTKQLDHEHARKFTHLERVHSEHDAIERTDGAFIALVQVEPPTMALATETEWAEKTDAFIDFLNTTVEFPIQIFSTTQAFPVDSYLAHYEDRLGDPDVQANPRLAALIDDYVGWYRSDLHDRQMTIRDHYVLVSVTPAEVQFDRGSHAQRLAGLPLVGLLVQAWFGPPEAEYHQAMFETLAERRTRVRTGLREIDGCAASPVSAADATRVIAEFWTGDDGGVENLAQALRTGPIVRGGH